jgi:hypothetical protein
MDRLTPVSYEALDKQSRAAVNLLNLGGINLGGISQALYYTSDR